jgi:D-alanine-D-alanine ligase
VALAAFRVTGCRDYARVDVRLNAQGHLFVLEVNSNPDIGPTGGFARALEVAGLAYDDFIDRTARGAAARRGATLAVR